MFTRLDYSSALEYSIIRRYTNIVYYYYYNNFSLNHFSSIDYFIITHNIYASIISNNVINEVTDPSNHNAILLSFSLNINLAPKVKDNCDLFNSNPLWKRASDNSIQEYTYTFDKFLSEIDTHSHRFVTMY